MPGFSQESDALRLLFESSPNPVCLLDAQTLSIVDCNAAALTMTRAQTKAQLVQSRPLDLAPEFQPDGRRSRDRVAEAIQKASALGSFRLEWVARRLDGELFRVEVVATKVRYGDREIYFVICREIQDEKQVEKQVQELNQQLEMRVRERTVELVQANEQLKAEARQRRRKEKIQEAIYQISEAVLLTDDLNSLYQQIHKSVHRLMPAKNFYLALRERGEDIVSFPYFVDEIDPPPQTMSVTTGLTGYVLRTGKPLLVNRQTKITKTASGIAMLRGPTGEGAYLESGTAAAVWLGAPLMVRGESIGVMAVQDYRNENAYGEEEKQILTFVAEQTALAIERKRAEQALRESEEKHRALFEASSQGVMLHDEHRFLEVNSAAVRILRFNGAEELIGRHPSETSAPTQPDGESADVLSRRHIQECMAKGSARFEWLARSPAGADIPIEVILTRIPWGGRHIIQAVINDISERKRAEAELLRALAREKELSQLKTNFVSTVSHEFRTPLGIIMSSAQILADYFDALPVGERQEHLLSITNNSRHMANLMEEVLLLSRADSGKMAFEPAPLNLPAFFRRLKDQAASASNQGCSIHIALGPDCTEAHADERLLGHIFANLLSNAVKYSPAGSQVEVSVRREGQEAVRDVHDRGIGIPEADREWLFDAFHRGRNVGDRPGTGLGLTIVKRCVELHDGRISIESAVGQGTRVTVRLPIFVKLT